MELYLISRTNEVDYDEYDSAVVAAPDMETAKRTQPDGDGMDRFDEKWTGWTSSIDLVQVRHIGTAIPGMEQGVICASFNAG